MMKLIFMDIDGTLTQQDGSVPKSAAIAIKQTREAGNQVILCTGRSLAEITPDISEIGFDGVIGTNGSYIRYNEEILLHEKMKEEDVHEIMNYLDENNVGYYLESNQGLYPSKYCISNIEIAAKKLFSKNADLFINQEDPIPNWFIELLRTKEHSEIPYHDINKISFISNGLPYAEVEEKYGNLFELYHSTVFEFGPESGEIALKGYNKKTAIETILRKVEGPFKTFAYGDGTNDIPMFESVHHAVAMQNAKQPLKDIADEITSISEEDGIYKSFLSNKLI